MASLYDLKRERFKDTERSIAEGGRGFGQAVLSLDTLRKEQEKIKRDQENKLAELGISTRHAEVAERNVGVAEKSEAERATQGKFDREGDTRKEERDVKAGQEKARVPAVAQLVRGLRAGGVKTFEDYAGNEPALLDLHPSESPRREIEGEFAAQILEEKEAADKLALEQGKLGVAGERAQAAKISASRPRSSGGGSGYGAGLSVGERGKVADASTQVEIIDSIMADLDNEDAAKPGFFNNLWQQGRRMIGMREAGDAAGAAALADVMAEMVHERYGAALTGVELGRAVQYIPDWKENPAAVKAMLGVLRNRYATKVKRVVDVADRDIKARGAPTDIKAAFQDIIPAMPGPEDVKASLEAKKNPQAAPADPRARRPGEKRREHALRLVEQFGVPLEQAFAEAAR